MNEEPTRERMTRRVFLKAGGVTAAAIGGGALLASVPLGGGTPVASAATPLQALGLMASDGFVWLPNIDDPDFGNNTVIPWAPDGPRGLYNFGFRNETGLTFTNAVKDAKGNTQFSAPFMAFRENAEVRLSLSNAGFRLRPDIPDGHTVHWHGFRQALPLFDGVPEVSVDVPPGHVFVYEYRPRDPGTFIYHCHWDDVEHVQMGMQGIVYIQPKQNLTPGGITVAGHNFTKFAYNDGNGSTGYDREYSLLLDDLWPLAHIDDQHIQDTLWSDYSPQYWTINGRCYPDTIKPGWTHVTSSTLPTIPSHDAGLPPASAFAQGANDPLRILGSQPNSSLIQCRPGDKVLLRFSNLGYQQQSMQLEGIPMKMVGEDANYLRGPQSAPGAWGVDLSYFTDTVYIGPGDSRDAIITAPAYSGSGLLDPNILPSNPYDRYLLMNRDLDRLNNYGGTTSEPGNVVIDGLGGQVTEVRVYRDPIPVQALGDYNKTYF